MDVVIVSKTHMSNAACVGGVLENGRFVRLLNEKGYNQNSGTSLNVGDVYSITFNEKSGKKPPHIEDILVLQTQFKYRFSSLDKLAYHLTENLGVLIWRGGLETLFDGNIHWTASGSGYISEHRGIPGHSVGFWISDENLTRKDYQGKVRYNYPKGRGEGNWRSIPFVGFQTPVQMIPAGTLLRVSLARWWSPNENEEKKCFLQLSGWYAVLQPETPQEHYSEFMDDNPDDVTELDDLPF
jgi:hypothetical protein